MNILFLGPPCPHIEEHLRAIGHTLQRTEKTFSLDFLQKNNFDFGISYGYRHILTPEKVRYFKGRIINMHISLLPWNRGSDPNFWSFLENTPKGVTIHRLDEGIDTGDILLQQEFFFDIYRETLRSSYITLNNSLQQLFLDHAQELLLEDIIPKRQSSGGTYHKATDKMPYLYLIEEMGWDTPTYYLYYKMKKNFLDK